MAGRTRARNGVVAFTGAGLLLAAMGVGVGCVPAKPQAEAGRKEFQALGWVSVPHGFVNMIGGNLAIERRDLDLDTQIGRLDLGATWNSATRDWTWSFEPTFDGATFRDASGAEHDVSALGPEAPVPGTHWVHVDATTMRTKGGLVHEFDTSGRLAAVRWRSATWPRLAYLAGTTPATVGHTVEIRQYESASSWTTMATIERDLDARVVAVEDRAGRRAEYARDAAGRLVTARDALDLTEGWPGFRYEYDANGHLAAITNSEGERVEYQASALRIRLVRRVGPGNPEWRVEYAKTGAISESVLEDPLGGRETWRYDDQRRVLERENAVGDVSSVEWNGLRPREFTTPDGVTTYYHVVDDDLVHVLQPSGNIVDFVWAPAAENRAAPLQRALAEVRDSLGVIETRTYDAAGRLAASTNGAGETWQYDWNGLGLLSERTDPAGRVTQYRDHGVHGHPRTIESAAGEATVDWDAVGNLESPGAAGGGSGGVIAREFDADRNLSRLVLGNLDALESTTVRTLDLRHRSDGRPVRIDRPYGGDTEWTYDAFGRLASRRDVADGQWRTTTWEHDLAGRALARTLANGMRTEWQRDAAGRATRIAHARNGVTEQYVDLTWSDGRIVGLVEPGAGSETHIYDSAGRLERIVEGGGDTRVFSYDERSRTVSEAYWLASGWPLAEIQVEYDGAGRESELRRGSELLRRRVFANGRLASEEFGSGIVRTDTYDPIDGLLAGSELRSPGGALLASATIARDLSAAGSGLLLWDATASSFGAVPATTQEQHWLAPAAPGEPGARIGEFAAGGAGTGVSRAWDALSNPLSLGDPGGAGHRTYHYDAQRTRLETVRNGGGGVVHSYAFDAAGFVTQRDGEPITWDAGGRPVAAPDAAWWWDALGRLRATTHSGVTTLRRFGGRVEAAPDGTPLALDLGPVVLDLTSGGGNHRFRHLDFRGNVKWVSDMSGTVVAHFGYGPHGVLAAHGASGGERTFAQGMPSGELLQLGHRLYDPEIGRFLAPDPVYQLVNQHGYTLGDPIHYWDPSGRQGVSAMTVASGVAAGTAIVGAVGLASAATLGAPAAVAIAFTGAALGASGVYAGLLAPASPVATGGALAIAALVNFPASSPFAGFAAGQYLQGILTDPTDLANRPRERPIATPEAVEPSGGSSSGLRFAEPSIGCSPTSLASSAPVVPRPLLLAAAAAQLVAAIWLVRRGREKRSS